MKVVLFLYIYMKKSIKKSVDFGLATQMENAYSVLVLFLYLVELQGKKEVKDAKDHTIMCYHVDILIEWMLSLLSILSPMC